MEIVIGYLEEQLKNITSTYNKSMFNGKTRYLMHLKKKKDQFEQAILILQAKNN